MKKIIIFGASASGRTAYMMLKKEYEVIGFSDNDQKKWGTMFCNVKVYTPSHLPGLAKKGIQIIIASVYYTAINKQLISMGITNNKLFYYFGNSMDQSYNGEYEIISLSEQNLFSTCKYESDIASKIEADFLVNYPKSKSIERVSLKDTKRKKVLFCAYIFPPIGGSGTQRSLKFVKYLREFGWEPIVLTVGKNDRKLGEDVTLLKELPDDITVVRIDDSVYVPEVMTLQQQQEVYNLYAAVMQDPAWLQEFCAIIENSSKGYKLIPDNHICWVNECLKQIDQLIDFSQIDMIFTTGNPFSDYILGWFLKKKYHIPWVQDYRDAWMGCKYYVEHVYADQVDSFALQKQLEQKLMCASDGVIMVAQQFINDYCNCYQLGQQKMIEITNGYDEDDFKGIQKGASCDDKFTICYNGSIYGDRSPLIVLKAVNELIDEKKIEKKSIQWMFNGTIEKVHQEQLDKEDKYRIIKNNGYLTHKDSVEKTINADVLVLLGLHDEGTKFGYTGKMFEYLRMDGFILGLSTPGGVYDDIFLKTNRGKNYEYNDIQGIKKCIYERYQIWEKHVPDLSNNDEEKISQYSRKNLTKKLAAFFDEILELRM